MKIKIFIIILLLTLLGTTAQAKVKTLEGKFKSNGFIYADWKWLRKKGDYALWTFEGIHLNNARKGSMYLNIHALVSNKFIGGSGYGTKITVEIKGGGITQTKTVRMINSFRPKDPEGYVGIGYDSYGHTRKISSKIWGKASKVTVKICYPFTNKRAVAFKKDSVKFGFRK